MGTLDEGAHLSRVVGHCKADVSGWVGLTRRKPYIPRMLIDPKVHRARPWRVHSLAPDFGLLDVWCIQIEAEPARGERFEDFVRVFLKNGIATDSAIANALFRIRFALGAVLRLDRTQATIADRLDERDRARQHPLDPGKQPAPITLLYLFDDEALVEISNRTIHALLHLGWVDADEPGKKNVELAIYTKSRGRMSDAYMALIGPFRHRLVYPPWLSHLRKAWTARATEP